MTDVAHATDRRRAPRRQSGLEPAGVVRLLEEVPDLVHRVAPHTADRLKRRITARLYVIDKGAWHAQDDAEVDIHAFGFLILDGLLVRRTSVGPRRSAELLGAEDLVRPGQAGSDEYSLVPHLTTWTVLAPARLALLDEEVVRDLAAVTGALPELARRLLARSRTLSLRLAIAQVPALDARLHLLLWHLADRWGRREKDGVVIPLRLRQELLAELVSAQRTSVNAALKQLVVREVIVQRPDGCWLLSGDPPCELLRRA